LPGSKTDRVFDAVDGASEAVSVFDNHGRFLSVNRGLEGALVSTLEAVVVARPDRHLESFA